MKRKTLAGEISEKLSRPLSINVKNERESTEDIFLKEIQQRQRLLKPGIWKSKS